MSERILRIASFFMLIGGFTLWSYGFIYSSFWYANADISALEPARIWLSEVIGQPIVPGMIEEILGLATAALGIVLQVMSYYGKRN